MYTPEYTITANILKNIADIEYSKAVIEHTTILPTWERQLQKEMQLRFILATLQMLGKNYPSDLIKAFINELETEVPREIKNIKYALALAEKLATSKELDENTLRLLNAEIDNLIMPSQKMGMLRNFKKAQSADPEEILAKIVEFFDWFNSLEAKETHPVILAAIMKAGIHKIQPFERHNEATANLMVQLLLKMSGYNFKDFLCIDDYYIKAFQTHEQMLGNIANDTNDLTSWITYFTTGLATEAANTKEKIKLLAKDTKVAKATGRTKITTRQERIVEHLQDYGTLQNKDFCKLFPDISEDSVLRDLKALLAKGIIVKAGSTKSSRYELT